MVNVSRKWKYMSGIANVSRKVEYKDVYRRTIDIPHNTGVLKANCCFKDHNAHVKLALLFLKY